MNWKMMEDQLLTCSITHMFISRLFARLLIQSVDNLFAQLDRFLKSPVETKNNKMFEIKMFLLYKVL